MKNNGTNGFFSGRPSNNSNEGVIFKSPSKSCPLFFDLRRRKIFFSVCLKRLLTGLFLSCFAFGTVWGQTTQPSDNLADALNNPELNNGVALYMTGDYDQCYNEFKKAFESNQQFPPPGILLARLFSDDGKFVLMRQYLEKTVDEYPNDPEAFFQLAGIAIQDQRFVEAALLIEKGKVLLDAFSKSRSSLKESQKDSRLEYLMNDALSIQANLAQQKGDTEKAIQYLKEILVAHPEDDWAQLSYGYLLYEQNRLDESLAAFSKAYELNAEHLPGWLILALLLEQSEKTTESQQYIKDNFKEETATIIQYYNVIQLYMKWNQVEKALSMAEELKTTFPNAVETWLLLGQISLYYHEYKVAEDYFRKALLISPLRFDANNGMALALCDQGSQQKMKQAVQMAYANWQRNKGSDEAMTTYAWILYLSGQKDDAELIFSPYLQSGKITPTVAYYLAEIAHDKGDDSLALNFIDLALNQATNFPKKVATKELREIISPPKADSKEETAIPSEQDSPEKTD